MTWKSVYLFFFLFFFFRTSIMDGKKAGHISILHTAVPNTFVTNRKSCNPIQEAGPTHFHHGLTVRQLFHLWSFIYLFIFLKCVFFFFRFHFYHFFFWVGPTITMKIKFDTTKILVLKHQQIKIKKNYS